MRTAIFIVESTLFNLLLLPLLESSPWQCVNRSVLPIKHVNLYLILNITNHLPLLVILVDYQCVGHRWNLVAIQRLLFLLLTKTLDSLINVQSLLCLQRRGAVLIMVLVLAALLLLTESEEQLSLLSLIFTYRLWMAGSVAIQSGWTTSGRLS